ncbi:hypothetical protein [Paraburkholderia sp. RL17-381-BIF-C]|uniref:hypothetical protein n=1 Tax=Paraburkholderia sp. RL17-381-BIF-C TaxID=3031635 RepID=UPI0038B93E53
MKLRIGDFYYGAALAQIAGYPVLTHVHGVDGKEGYFQINDNKRLLIKYATTGNGTWRFTVRPEDLAVLSDRADYEIWFALVCGESTICLLDEDQLQSVVDIESSTSQWI